MATAMKVEGLMAEVVVVVICLLSEIMVVTAAITTETTEEAQVEWTAEEVQVVTISQERWAALQGWASEKVAEEVSMIEEADRTTEVVLTAVKWAITQKIALKLVVAVAHQEEEVTMVTGGAIETIMSQEKENQERPENLENKKSQDLQHTDSTAEDIEEALRAGPMFPVVEEQELPEVE